MIPIEGKLRAPMRFEDFTFYPGVVEAVRDLRAAGFLTVVVTNQPDVARGWQKREVIERMNDRVRDELQVDLVQVCYHDYRDACDCRKPKPGMLTAAAAILGIDLERSFIVGDRFGDVMAGRAAGCATILVGPGDAEEHATRYPETPEPDARTESLREAADWILRRQ